MAIKRTILRQNFVTNTAMPESAGHAMAQASKDIGNAISYISNNVDKNQFETYKLEAEKQGKILGQRTEIDPVTKKSVIKPLDMMSLNSFQPDMYNKANQRKLQEYFKEQAINSYSLALSNDALDSAENSVIQNKGKLDENGKLLVQSSKESYLKSIKGSVPPEVWANISPGLERIWGSAQRKASAYQVDDARKLNYSNATKTLDFVNNYEQNLIINGTEDPSEYEYINKAKENAFKLIDDNAPSSAEASNIKIAYNTKLQTGVSVNAVSMAHASGMSDSDLLKMANDTKIKYNLDKNIQSTDVYNSMINEIARLDKIDTQEQKTISANSVLSANKMLLGIAVNNVYPTQNEIGNLKAEHQIQVYSAISAKQKLVETNSNKIYNDNILRTILAVKNDNINVVEQSNDSGDDFTQDDISWLKQREKIRIVKDLVKNLGHKELNITTESKIYDLTREIAEDHATKTSDEFKANMTLAMSGNGDFVLIPSQLRSASYVNMLIKNNIIGNESFHAFTRDGWQKEVNRYEKDYNKSNQTASVLSTIPNYIENNIPLNSNQKNELEKVIKPTFQYNGEEVNFDVLNADQNIRQKSIEAYTSLSISNGHVPEPLKDILNNIKQLGNDETFGYAKQAYFSLKEEYIKAKGGRNGGGLEDWITFSGKDRNNLNTDLLDSSDNYEDVSKFAQMNSNVSAGRNLNSMFAHLKESDLTDNQIVEDGIQKILEVADNNFVQRWFVSDVDGNETENNVVRTWLDQQGYGNFSEAIINNPSITNEIIKGVKYKVISNQLNLNQPEKALLSAVKSEFYNMTGQLSLHKDRFGVVHLIKGSSALRVAQSKVPKNAVTLTKDDLIRDVTTQYNASFGGGTQNEYIKEAIKNGDIMFIPNNEVVGEKTFRVTAFGSDGTAELLADNYTWDWDNSQTNKDYKDALQKISNGGVRKLLSSFDFMSKNNLEAVMSSIKNNRDQAETWVGIVNTYNKIALGFNNMPTSPSNMLPIINYVKSKEGIKELEEYFDDKRLFRFDLR